MAEQAAKDMNRYLSEHAHMTLATVSASGTPMAHDVSYVSVGSTVYFSTDSKTRKAANIAENRNVAFTVSEQYSDFSQIQGVQMAGEAEAVTDEEKVQKVMSLFIEKFPFMAEMTSNPEMDFRVFEIKPKEGWWIDNRKGFGNREWLTL